MAPLSVQLFGGFWIAAVLFYAFRSLRSGLHGLQTGTARLGWMQFDADRAKQPVEYWLAITGAFGTAFLLAPLMILFALDIML